MKRKNVLRLVLAGSAVSCMVLAGVSAAVAFNKPIENAEAASEFTSTTIPDTMTINLNDCSDSEIREYYSALDNKTSDELSGTNLLKNLKAIISKNVSYYSYTSGVSKAYVITDRDWTNSPASAISGYNASTNTISSFSHSNEVDRNPYLRLLYCNYDVQGKTLYTGDGDVDSGSVSFDKEHAWSQSHGFDNGTSSGQNLTGAGSDLHHLKAGTQYGNRTLHSNYSYGFVKANDGDWSSKPYENLNKRGAPLFAHSGQDQQSKVFEPQDCDKGDIARALLYMVACYNNYDGSTPTPANPALLLVNYVISGSTTGYSSEDITNGYYGVLQDILAWHRMDPVDEYEIHRNNLIYRNYQHNRNPFIDFPEWVDYIWGTSEYDPDNKTIDYDSTSTGYVDLEQDEINGYRASTKTLVSISVTTAPTKTSYYVGEEFDKSGAVVTATYDDNSHQVVTRNCKFTADTSVAGNVNVTVSYKDKTCTTPITVLPCTAPTESVTLNRNSAIIAIGNQLSLKATVGPINAANKNVIWSTSDATVATVSNGTVIGVDEGEAVITATSASDSSIKATCNITVRTAVPKVLITDSITRETTGVSGNNYVDWDSKKVSSNAIYAGRTSAGGGTVVAFRTSGSNEGIVTTTSGGIVKKVTINWYTEGGAGTTLNVYGSHSAYSVPSQLFSSATSGDLLGTITKSGDNYLEITGEYEYIGLRSASGVLYMNQIDIQWEAEASSEEIPVNGVALDKATLNIEKGDTYQFTATVYPLEATDKNVDYSTSSPSVAQVTSEGLLTALEIGTTTITVTTEDGNFTATCTVNVINVSDINSYVKQTSTSGITTGYYVIAAIVDGQYRALNSTNLSYGNVNVLSSGAILESEATDYKFHLTVSGTSVTIKDGDKAKTLSHSAANLAIGDTSQTWTLSLAERSDETLGIFSLTSSTDSSRRIAYSTQYSKFGAYSPATTGYKDLQLFKLVENTGTYNIDNFVSDFLTKITCDATGATAPTFATGYSWSELATKFNSLTTTEKNEMKTLVADKNGNNKEICAAKYDLLVSKYGYNNFMDRTIVSHSNIVNNIKTNNVIIMVVAVSMISMSSAAFFIFRKKKEN